MPKPIKSPTRRAIERERVDRGKVSTTEALEQEGGEYGPKRSFLFFIFRTADRVYEVLFASALVRKVHIKGSRRNDDDSFG